MNVFFEGPGAPNMHSDYMLVQVTAPLGAVVTMRTRELWFFAAFHPPVFHHVLPPGEELPAVRAGEIAAFSFAVAERRGSAGPRAVHYACKNKVD